MPNTIANTLRSHVDPSVAAVRGSLTRAQLLALPAAELVPVFASGSIQSVDELGERPHGDVVSFVPTQGALDGIAQRIYRSPKLVWEGKSFYAASKTQGRGANRVHLFGRREVFPFRIFLADSLIDGLPVLAIDYDLPENPSIVRLLYDEVRRVGPGVYLGRGMARRRGAGPQLLLWFGLDATHQDAPLP